MSNGPEFRRRSSFLLATLGRRTESAWSGFLRARGVTNSEFSALAVLVSESPGQGELAGYLGIDPRNTGALVRKLSARGWASTSPHPDDRRRTVIAITPAGREAWQEIQDELGHARSDYFVALDEDEKAEVQRLLNKLNDAHLRSGEAGA